MLAPFRNVLTQETARRIREALVRIEPFRPILFVEGLRPVVRVCAIAVNGAGADINRFRQDLDRARAVWGPCGIRFGEGSFTTINAALDYPNWVDYRSAPPELLNQRGGCAATDIRLYYVRSIAGNRFQGRSAFTFGEPGYVAVGADAHPNLFPHELGHVFLGGNEEHRDSASQADLVNIMRSDVGSIQGTPQVDQGQCTRVVARVRSSQGSGGSHPAMAPNPAQILLIGALQHPDLMVRIAALRGLGLL